MTTGATGKPGSTRHAIDELAALSGTVLTDWTKRASKVADQFDSGTLTADQAAQDFGEWTAFTFRSLALAAKVAMDLAATAGSSWPPGNADRRRFATPKTATRPGPRMLALRDDLRAEVGTDSIPKDRVKFIPEKLTTGQTGFELEVDATGHHAVGYRGVVDVSDAAGNVVESIDVYFLAE